MMSKIILPPKYYLDHFFEFLEFIEKHYSSILENSQMQFISDFRALSEDAQCAYIRMINRKGYVFDPKNFQKYQEIKDVDSSLNELILQGFAGYLTQNDKLDLLLFMTKSQIALWLANQGLLFPKNASRDHLIDLARRHLSTLNIETAEIRNLIVQRRTNEMQYLLFLYFGQIQKSLNLYTLRDLGIRKSGTLKTKFTPRFSSKQQAQTEYFFARQLQEDLSYFKLKNLKDLFQKICSYRHLPSTTQVLKDDLLLEIADYALNLDPELSLAAWNESRHISAREKTARLIYKLDRKDECLKLLESILLDPRSDEELLFAEDFLARKFNKKKIGVLSEILNNSKLMTLSDFYLKRPEYGVLRHLEKLDHQVWFTENYLWVSLFGLLFWEELFESKKAAIHNPFERSPSDLVSTDFYKNHQKSIEKKLNQLSEKLILQKIALNYGKLNDVFRWSTQLAGMLVNLIKNSTSQNLPLILRTMAKNYETHHSGFPDLMTIKDGKVRFIEVKAEGDALRHSQLGKIRLLKEAGFDVEVLRVQWQTDPHQQYVVVDVETTGGSAGFHRVTEIGAVKVQDGKVIEEFQTLINPGRPIPPFITQITGITDDMVANAPVFSEVAGKFLKFMEDSLFVAHNVKFDYGFIQREFARAEIEFVRPQLCTCAGMRKAFPGLNSYGLKNLSQHFNIKLERHHRALDDARAAAELLILMNERRRDPNQTVTIYTNPEPDHEETTAPEPE